jgi:hypothetical protein
MENNMSKTPVWLLAFLAAGILLYSCANVVNYHSGVDVDLREKAIKAAIEASKPRSGEQ